MDWKRIEEFVSKDERRLALLCISPMSLVSVRQAYLVTLGLITHHAAEDEYPQPRRQVHQSTCIYFGGRYLSLPLQLPRRRVAASALP
jgi:hypothetical protein